MRTLVIMRGIPGSGKSSIALALAAQCADTVICEADQFFNGSDGKYHYLPHLVPTAHLWCYNKAKAAMEQDTPLVIVSNTSTQRARVEQYLELASVFGYQVQQIVVFGDFGSVHNVPDVAMERMKKQLHQSLTAELRDGLLP